MAKKQQEMVTYIVTLKNGTRQKITVPAAWKVTFGPVSPGSKGGYTNGEGGMCLRFYESQTQQRAVFLDVRSFRDSSIAITEEVTKTQAKRMRKTTPQGEKDFVVEAKVTQWRNPDDPESVADEFLALPGEKAEEDIF